MSKSIDGTTLFTTMKSGLTNTFSVLSSQFEDGLTLENLASSSATTALTSNSLGVNFKSYLQSNFSKVDKDSDGVISADELSSLTTNLTNGGMTLDQLYQLGTSGGISSSLLETVASHFNEIDKNKDGKVTNQEIQAYGVESNVEKQRLKDRDRTIANMSTYYGSDTVEDTGSLLDYKYMSDDKDEDA